MKKHVQASLPSNALQGTKRFFAKGKIARAEGALQRSSTGPEWLGVNEFKQLLFKYPVAFHRRDFERHEPDRVLAGQVLKQIGASPKSLLEIGGGRGLTAWALALADKQVTVLDVPEKIEDGAASSGVRALAGDPRRMPFDDNEFDAVYSFDTFQHLDHADQALLEAWRVVKPGGTVYLNFAPIYNSPLGLHAFYEIGIPYAQHLWSEDTLRPFVTSQRFWELNYWPLRRYREMCASLSPKLELVEYHEELDLKGIELIERFPACFQKRSRNLDEFIVSKLTMKFRALKLSFYALFLMGHSDLFMELAAVTAKT